MTMNAKSTAARPKVALQRLVRGDNANLQYCLLYLKNGGEEVRAIRLLMDITGMDAKAARDHLRALKMPRRIVDLVDHGPDRNQPCMHGLDVREWCGICDDMPAPNEQAHATAAGGEGGAQRKESNEI